MSSKASAEETGLENAEERRNSDMSSPQDLQKKSAPEQDAALALDSPVQFENVVAAIRSAAQEVFSTMLNLPLEEGPAYQQAASDPAGSYDGVEALVGIGGSWTGSGRICCSAQFACKMAGALLMTPYDSLDEDVLDAMSEVANMIIGNVKTHFEELLGPLGLSIPTVIFGRNYHTRSAGVTAWTVAPFTSGTDTMEVRFCLMRSRGVGANAGKRPVNTALEGVAP